MMTRRDFAAGATLVATLGSAQASRAAKQYRIATLDPAFLWPTMREANHPIAEAWWKEMQRLGYVEGQNLIIERYSGHSNYSPDLAREVVATNPDLIFCPDGLVVRDLATATRTIPIVGIISTAVQTGNVANLARPEGNITGVGLATGVTGFEDRVKRLTLLREMVPNMSTFGYLTVRVVYESVGKPYVEKLAKDLGMTVVGPFLERPVTEGEIRRVVAAMSEERVDALYVNDLPEIVANAPLVVRLAQEFRLPAVYPFRYYAQIGGLMSYAFDNAGVGRILADQIDQVLKGAKPGDIPIYQGDRFTLSINLKTAKALDLIVPPSLFAQADEVIE
jgi:putative tryptophan/tyrosine transport system substrate-binding protein